MPPTLRDRTIERANRAKWQHALEQKPEFNILRSLTLSSGDDAVRAVVQLTLAALPSRQLLGNQLYDTACSVVERAQQLPADNDTEEEGEQAALVAFLLRLQTIRLEDPTTGGPVVYENGVVWAGLPTFGYTFADELGAHDPNDPSHTPVEVRRWESLTAFVARLTGTDVPALDFSSWALTAFYYAFGPAGTGPGSEGAVRAACLWVRWAGKRLVGDMRRGGDAHGVWEEAEAEKRRQAWEGCKAGLTGCRGRVWAEEETGRVVEEALAEIKRLESEAR